MKQVDSQRLSWLLFLVVLINMAESQPSTDINSTLMGYYCSQYKGVNGEFFLRNLNATLSSLRHQISITKFASARTLINGESVWGLAWCRGYVSLPDCLTCFNYAVTAVKPCGLGNGARVIYSDCELRYQSNNILNEGNNGAGVVRCGDTPSPLPTQFRKAAEKLISDLQIAVPRTPDFYAVSTREEAGGNATVYAIAQCNLNVSKSICVECLQLRSQSLYDCLPSTNGRATDNACFMRYSRTPFFGLNKTTDISSLLYDDDSKKKRYIIIGGVVGGTSVLLFSLAYFLWYGKSKNKGRGQRDISTGSTSLLQGPATYTYNALKVATNNFSDENKLGGGVFGEVYKGTLTDGGAVAIKKTFMASGKGKTRFNDELKVINNVHHRHLVRMLGYCTKGPHLFLVQEYMEKGSLDQFLYGDHNRRILNWKQRFDIIFGIASGLAYLHEQYHVTIIHRDIKTSNILLDSEFQPKIADFGLIRLLPEDNTHLTTKFAESLNSGYVAPEYAIHGRLSVKVDTYSFGIVVLEIISGKRYTYITDDDQSVAQNLLDHAWNLYENGTQVNLVDDKLDHSEYDATNVMKIIEIALMCTQPADADRPVMSEVVAFLSDYSLEERPPVRSNNNLEDEVRIEVPTKESSSSNATASTVQLSDG